MPIIAKQVVSNAEAIATDRLDELSEILWNLVINVLTIYDPALASAFLAARNATKLPGNTVSTIVDELIRSEEFSQISIDHLVSALACWIRSRVSNNRRAYLAKAWVQFSVALIKLFVPDKAYDPQLRPQLELESYEELLRTLNMKLERLQTFEEFQTGQSTNLRCELLKEEITDLGAPPSSVQAVYRPWIPRSFIFRRNSITC